MYQSFIKPLLKDIKNFTVDVLFPLTCVSCGAEGYFVCPLCLSGFTQPKNQRCIVCNQPSVLGFTHSGCQTPHGADGLVSFFSYQDDRVAKALIDGKYHFLPGVFEILAQSVCQKIQTGDYKNLFSNFILVPLPLAPSRKRWRGFNQTEVICRSLNQHLGLEAKNILIRTKVTKTQKDLKKEQRSQNVEGAFALSPPFQGGVDANLPTEALAKAGGGRGGWSDDDNSIKNKNFLIVDDVVTTGSTLREAVKVLKRSGAQRVWCLTLAQD